MDVLEKLIDLGADVNAPDWLGWTPLHHCFRDSSPYTRQLADMLLKNGANVDSRDRFLATPLCQASTKRDLKGIDLLIEWGADPAAKE